MDRTKILIVAHNIDIIRDRLRNGGEGLFEHHSKNGLLRNITPKNIEQIAEQLQVGDAITRRVEVGDLINLQPLIQRANYRIGVQGLSLRKSSTTQTD